MTYDKKLENEIRNYRHVENVHDLPASQRYIARTYLEPLCKAAMGLATFPELVAHHVRLAARRKPEAQVTVVSLGTGNCDFEIALLADQGLACSVECWEINPHMLDRARQNARDKGVFDRIAFKQGDINKLRLEGPFDVVVAEHSLHHFVELEHIFAEVDRAMTDESYFVINDMIGRNGHMFWPPTFDLCNRIWDTLPRELKYDQQARRFVHRRRQVDASRSGFEGIRAQDILPLLDRTFQFKDLASFYAITTKFVDRDFGHDYDLENPLHRAILDTIWQYDDFCLRRKILRPTQMLATAVKRSAAVDQRTWTYFEHAREIYEMPDDRFYEVFNRRSKLRDSASRLLRAPRGLGNKLRSMIG